MGGTLTLRKMATTIWETLRRDWKRWKKTTKILWELCGEKWLYWKESYGKKLIKLTMVWIGAVIIFYLLFYPPENTGWIVATKMGEWTLFPLLLATLLVTLFFILAIILVAGSFLIMGMMGVPIFIVWPIIVSIIEVTIGGIGKVIKKVAKHGKNNQDNEEGNEKSEESEKSKKSNEESNKKSKEEKAFKESIIIWTTVFIATGILCYSFYSLLTDEVLKISAESAEKKLLVDLSGTLRALLPASLNLTLIMVTICTGIFTTIVIMGYIIFRVVCPIISGSVIVCRWIKRRVLN